MPGGKKQRKHAAHAVFRLYPYQPFYAADVRIFKLSNHFRERFNQLRGKLRKAQLRLMRQQSLAQAGAGMSAFVVNGRRYGINGVQGPKRNRYPW